LCSHFLPLPSHSAGREFSASAFSLSGLWIFAYAFGIVFQYFTIGPLRGISFGKGLLAAIKADTLSLTAWQVGMYGFMAIAYFAIFRAGLGVKLATDTPEFWFMMQIAMLCGFVTAYPVNWWLLHKGLKERM
jgi:hypothetical protein